MKILTPGHKYQVANFEDRTQGQTIQFIEKTVTTTPGSSELVTVHDGTTNEELLSVLINRLEFLKYKLPSRETAIALTHIETALLWLEKRTRDRQNRGVEGTHQP